MTAEPIRIPGTSFLYELQDGESWAVLPNGIVIVCHPERVPKLISRNGTIEELKLCSQS